MPTAVLRPNATASNTGWSVVGAASAHAALRGVYFPASPTAAADGSSVRLSGVAVAGVSVVNLEDAPADFGTSNSLTLRAAMRLTADPGGPDGSCSVLVSLVVGGVTIASVNVDTLSGDVGSAWFAATAVAGSWTAAQLNGATIEVDGDGDATAIDIFAVEAALSYVAAQQQRYVGNRPTLADVAKASGCVRFTPSMR
jgi:hypothetical protein